MKKFWIYLAVPVALLNGCQQQQAALEETKSLAAESSQETGSQENGTVTEAVETLISQESEEESISDDKPGESAAESTSGGIGESPAGTGAESASTENPFPPAPPVPMADQHSIREALFEGSTVSIVQSEKEQASEITEEEIEAMVREAAWDLDTVVKNGQTVVIKPNLVQMIVDSTGERLDQEVNGVTTDWRVAKAVVKMVRELNPDGKVYIMEGSATGPTKDVMEYFHYTSEYMDGVDDFICLEEDCGAWQDFDAPEIVKVDLPDGLLHKSYYFNKILYEADVMISIPSLKTSSGVVVTAGIKNVSLGTPPGNLYGMGPDNPSKKKMVSHNIADGELDKWIYDYYKAKPISYVIVDGLQGFQSGPVPMSHERKETDKMNMRLILGGKDPVAVDTICSLVMGWDPESVGYLKLFQEQMDLGSPDKIRVKGAYVDEVRTHFTIYKEELGGIPIEDTQGPQFSGKMMTDGENIAIRYTARDAERVEVLVDGVFQGSQKAEEEGQIHLMVPGFSKGEHEVKVAAYDRFLNKCVEIMN